LRQAPVKTSGIFEMHQAGVAQAVFVLLWNIGNDWQGLAPTRWSARYHFAFETLAAAETGHTV
jgi:hypothetical protein